MRAGATADVVPRWAQRLTAGRIASGYAILAVTWIVFSDAALAWLSNESVELLWGQALKGTVFVLATAALMWFLLRGYMHALAQSHEQRRLSDRTLTTLLSNLPGMAYRCYVDRDRTLLFASEGARDLIGYDLFSEDGEGEEPVRFAALVDERDRDHVRHRIETAVYQDQPFQITYRIRNAAGDVRWVWEQGRAVNGGDVIEGFITDITEEKRARLALQQSENRYRMLIETAMEGVVVIDRAARILFVNPQMGKLLDYAVSEMVGRPVAQFIDPDLRDDLEQRLERRWRGEAEQYETRFVCKDGSLRWVILTTNPIFDAEGAVTGALGMATDITQRVAAETKLRESEQRYRALADSRKLLLNELDHRVKNNLAGLHALLSMYARSAKSVEDFAEFMRQKLVAMTTVHEMVAAAKWEPIRLRELIRHTSEQFRVPGSQQQTIDLQGPALTVPPRQAGPLIMILHELLTNSRKHGAYSQAGGHITIAWEADSRPDGRRSLTLRWVESGGPAIREPATAGLGLGLVEGFVRHELDGSFAYDLNSQGFRCTIDSVLDKPDPASSSSQPNHRERD